MPDRSRGLRLSSQLHPNLPGNRLTTVFVEYHISQRIHPLDHVRIALPHFVEMGKVLAYQLLRALLVPDKGTPGGMMLEAELAGLEPLLSWRSGAQVDVMQDGRYQGRTSQLSSRVIGLEGGKCDIELVMFLRDDRGCG